MITHFPHRRPRAHLITVSPRHIALAVVIALSAAVGFGLMAQRVHVTPAAPVALIRTPGA